MRKRVGEMIHTPAPIQEAPVDVFDDSDLDKIPGLSPLDAFIRNLESKIKNAYEGDITIPEAEKLAAEFLHAHLVLSREYQKASLDARMRKSGLKAIKAAIYLTKARETERKPSDAMLGAMVDQDNMVCKAQGDFDSAETQAELIRNYLDVAQSGHHYFKQLAKGVM